MSVRSHHTYHPSLDLLHPASLLHSQTPAVREASLSEYHHVTIEEEESLKAAMITSVSPDKVSSCLLTPHTGAGTGQW